MSQPVNAADELPAGPVDRPVGRGHRSPVRERVVLIPMAIRMQDDGGEVVAVLPGWFLPPNTLAKATTEAEAIKALQSAMWNYWGKQPPNAGDQGRR
jgi:hypothetical protein